MLPEILVKLFVRDLDRLKNEITSYQNEGSIWKTRGEIKNSAGNLCLHLIGNLNTYIGAVLGDTGYIRKREDEFSLKNIPKESLLENIEITKEIILKVVPTLSEKDLEKEYPVQVFDKKTSTGYLLVHLTTHLGYHLGQINYHRRLIES